MYSFCSSSNAQLQNNGVLRPLAVQLRRKAIARLRLAKLMTQEELAEQLEIGSEAVSRLERGVVMPTVGRLVELANLLDCDVAELLAEVSPRISDQAQHLSRLLANLSEHDRTLVIEVVEKLTARLAQP